MKFRKKNIIRFLSGTGWRSCCEEKDRTVYMRWWWQQKRGNIERPDTGISEYGLRFSQPCDALSLHSGNYACYFAFIFWQKAIFNHLGTNRHSWKKPCLIISAFSVGNEGLRRTEPVFFLFARAGFMGYQDCLFRSPDSSQEMFVKILLFVINSFGKHYSMEIFQVTSVENGKSLTSDELRFC